jgi:hypothetical protein
MVATFRKIPAALVPILAGLFLGTAAVAGTTPNLYEIGPRLAANNVPEPQLMLAGTIMILFAGSLCLLVLGYVVDSTRAAGESPP